MSLAVITAKQVLQLFLLIFTGAACYKLHLLHDDAKPVFSDLLLYLIAPAMILDSYMVEFDPETFHNLMMSFRYSAILMVGGLLITLLVTSRMTHPDKTVIRFGCTFSNAGYMGFPLIRALFGQEGLLYASAFLTLFNILLWTAGYAIMVGTLDKKAIFKTIITSPSIIAVVLGLIIYLNRIPVSDMIQTPIGLIGDMNTPLSMIVTGITIAGSQLKRLFSNRRLILMIGLRIFLIPLLGLAVMKLLHASGIVATIVLILEACPTAAITTMFSIKYHHNEELAAGAVILSTLLSVVTLPLFALLLSSVL